MENVQFPQLAVIVPCYNVQDACVEVFNRIHRYGCFTIAVNDGSNDRTGEILKHLGVTVITHNVNRGKGSALRSGFEYFLEQGDWPFVATVDADGQHDPHEIPRMMEMLERESIDLLIGSRQFELSKMPFKRWIANKVSSFVISQCIRARIRDIQSGYRIYSRTLLQRIFPRIQASGFEIETELLVLALRHQAVIREISIPSIYSEGSNASSNWRAFHDSIRIAKTILPYLFKK